nr:helix-turn-helix transcriptional regulator [Proteiniborus sp. DW1]
MQKLRKERSMFLSELGGEYVSKAQLSYIENGKASPSIDLLKYLSQKLDVDLEYLHFKR